MAITRQMPEVLSAPVRLFHGVTLAVSSLMGRRRYAAGRLRQQPSFLARFPQRPEDDGVVDGWVRVVIPANLVRPGQAPQRPADPSPDAGPPVWESEEQPLNDALVDLLSEHGHPWALPAAAEINRWAVLPAAPTTSRPRPTAPESWRPDSTTFFGMLYDHLTNEVQLRLSLERLLRHGYEVLVGGEKVTAGMRITRLIALPESDVEILSRHFNQGRDTEEHLGGTTGGWFAAVGAVGGWEVDDNTQRAMVPLRYESQTSEDRAAESEEILERNMVSVRPFRYYKADVEIALSGPHGKLLVQAPGGLYFMLPVAVADSPAVLEVLVTEPEPDSVDNMDNMDNGNDDTGEGGDGAGDGDNGGGSGGGGTPDAGPVSHAERPVGPLDEAFLTRINGDAASDGHSPEPPVSPAPPLVPAPGNESDMLDHQSDGAETTEASAERFLILINGDQRAADAGIRTDEE